jgi:predicted AlkP superfamily phosphohydrolase/phosphomutase
MLQKFLVIYRWSDKFSIAGKRVDMISSLKIRNFKPVLSGFILAFPAALLILAVKIISYPRTVSDLLYFFKEFRQSLNIAAFALITTFAIFHAVFLINKRRLNIFFSIFISLLIFWGIAYYINRVVFKDYYENTGFVGGIRVRLVFITPKIVLIDSVLLTGFIIGSYFAYRLIKKMFRQARKRGIFNGSSQLLLFNKTLTTTALSSFIAINLIHFALGYVLLPSRPSSSGDLSQKVYFIGLDGADWNIIDPLIKQGKLPTFKKLVENGCRGTFLSQPNYAKSGPSWSSIATGMTVAKHGIRNNSGMIERPRIWNILNEFHRKVTVVNYLCSPYPEKLNGAFITGPYDHLATYPAGLLNELNYYFGPYFADVDAREISDQFLDSCFTVIRQQAKAVNFLIDKFSPSFLCAVFVSSDRLQHFFWQFYEPDEFYIDPNSESARKYADVIPKYYMEMDTYISEIIAKADKNTTFILTADHGFKAIPRKSIATNDIEINYLLQVIDLYRLDRNMLPEKMALYAEELTDAGRPKRRIRYSDPILKDKLIDFFQSVRIKEDHEPCFIDVAAEDSSLVLRINTRIYELNTVNVILQYEDRLYEYPLEKFISRNELRTGDHRREGFFLTSGNKIRKGGDLGYIKAYDITPTILALMNLPIGYDMDGIPLTDAFSENYKKDYRIRYIKSYDFVKTIYLSGTSNQKETLQKLRSLGYIN